MLKLDNWLSERVDQTKAAGLYRRLRSLSSGSSTVAVVDGQKSIVFSSNNYLGLANDRRLVEAARVALDEFGVGSSGSRLTTGDTTWHQKLEEKIASFKQTEAALLFSSGYLANVGVISSLAEKGDVILSDQLNHASIIDGCRLAKADTVVYRHIDLYDLEEKLEETAHYKRRFIVTDGVFSMDGTIAPLDHIMKLAKQYDAFVIVDDAHATGVLGEKGRGASSYFGVEPDVVIGTLSKAIGTEGGFVAGSRMLIDFLLNHARTFIFQTAMPPSICAASYVALNIIEKSDEKRGQLFYHVQKVKRELIEMGFHVKRGLTPIIPVIIGDAEAAYLFAEKLQENGIYAPAIRPPTVPNGMSRIRLTITADHQIEAINYLLDCFYSIGKELRVI